MPSPVRTFRRWSRVPATTGLLLAGLLLIGLAAPPEAAAQAAAGPYGAMMTYGYYGGVGPYGWGPYAYGTTPYGVGPTPSVNVYNQDQIRLAQQMRQSARYQYATARAAAASAAANALRQQAIEAAAAGQNQQMGLGIPRFNVQRRAPVGAAARPLAPDREQARVLSGVVDATGQMLWPVPLEDVLNPAARQARARVEAAVQNVYQGYVAEGRAPIRAVVEARTALRTFGEPVLNGLELVGDGVRHDRLVEQLNSVDAALMMMGNPPPAEAN